MNIIVAFLFTVAASCGLIYSLDDIDDPIQYIDKSSSYFLAVDGGRFRMGTPINAVQVESNDVSQFSGEIEDCSSHLYRCKSISYLQFFFPRRQEESFGFDNGLQVTGNMLPNGTIHVSAICPRLAETGCVNRADGSGPAVTYQYVINGQAVLTEIKVQHWNEQHVQIAHEDLALTTQLGLKLD